MRTIIAGSRDITSFDALLDAVNACGWTPTVVLSGTARGVDRLGERFATLMSLPCERFPANWGRYRQQAGYMRNVEMAEHADALIALWDGKSRGTEHMIEIAKKWELRLYVHQLYDPRS